MRRLPLFFLPVIFLATTYAITVEYIGNSGENIRFKTASSGAVKNTPSAGITHSGPSTVSLPKNGLIAYWNTQISAVTISTNGSGAAPANGGVVGRVTDLSGNFNDLVAPSTGQRPIWDADFLDYGIPAIINTSTTILTEVGGVATALSGTNKPFTIVCAYLADGYAGDKYLFGAVNSGSSASLINFLIEQDKLFATSQKSQINLFKRNNANVGGFIISAGGWASPFAQVNSITWDGTNIAFYQNNATVLASTASTATGATTITHFSVGGRWDGIAQSGSGVPFVAMAVYNRVLSTAELSQAQQFMQGQIHIPFDNPVTPKISLFIGDSRTEKDSTTPQNFRHWPKRLQQDGLLANEAARMWMCGSYGAYLLNGGEADEIVAKQWGFDKSLLSAGDYLFASGGMNDMRDLGTVGNDTQAETHATTLFGEFIPIINEAVETVGMNVFVRGMEPNTSMPATSVNRRHGTYYYNRLLKEYVNRFDRAIYVESSEALYSDASTFPGMNVIYNDPSDGSPTLHFNALGCELIKDMHKPAIAHLRNNPATNANIKRWYSARTGTAYADGNLVTSLVDRSVSADNATALNAPIYSTSVYMSRPAILFDGSDDCLAFTEVSYSVWTVSFAVSVDSFGTLVTHHTQIGQGIFIDAASGMVTYTSPGSSQVMTWNSGTLNNFDVITVNSSGKMWVNGVPKTDGVGTTGLLVVDRLSTTPSDAFYGYMGDVLIQNTVATPAEMNIDEQYIAYKYKKTWTNIQ